MKYIDADRLRVEIEQRLDKLNPKVGMFGDRPLRAVNPKTFPRESELEKVLGLIDSLQQEQPEVNLEKEIEEHVENMPMSEFTHESEVDAHWDWARKEFRYFFGLGLNARKEE